MKALEKNLIPIKRLRDSLPLQRFLYKQEVFMAKKGKKFTHPDSQDELTDEQVLNHIERTKLEGLRKDFRTMVNRCMCTGRSFEGACFPSKCYPRLYKRLYPQGGYYQRKAVGNQLFLRASIAIGKKGKLKKGG